MPKPPRGPGPHLRPEPATSWRMTTRCAPGGRGHGASAEPRLPHSAFPPCFPGTWVLAAPGLPGGGNPVLTSGGSSSRPLPRPPMPAPHASQPAAHRLPSALPGAPGPQLREDGAVQSRAGGRLDCGSRGPGATCRAAWYRATRASVRVCNTGLTGPPRSVGVRPRGLSCPVFRAVPDTHSLSVALNRRHRKARGGRTGVTRPLL